MGKPVEKVEAAAKVGGDNVPDTSLLNENEAFSRMVEDPMIYIKQREAAKRDEVYFDQI